MLNLNLKMSTSEIDKLQQKYSLKNQNWTNENFIIVKKDTILVNLVSK